VKQINPRCEVRPFKQFYSAETADEILEDRPDYVIDAIDKITANCQLLAECKGRGIPVVCSTGAGARLDPTQIRVADLAETTIDPLAKNVRRILREKYGFPTGGRERFGIPAVYSPEPPMEPMELHYDGGRGFRCVCPHGENGQHECEKRNRIDGTAGFVTGAFGLTSASVAVRALLEGVRPDLSTASDIE
jgi:tRNA A37 threonylcarbamoyladenosine dehydratase